MAYKIPLAYTKSGSTATGFTELGASDLIASSYVEGTGTVSSNAITFEGGASGEYMVNIRGDAGIIPVLHYNFIASGDGFPDNGQLIGGAGSRPWTGTDWSDHSTAAYHLLSTEDHSASAQGTDFSVLATPIGGLQSNRIYVANFNGDGDIICSKGVLKRKFLAADRGKGIEIARDGSAAELTMVSNAAGYSTLFRLYSIGGTLSAPSATQAGQSTGFGLCGWGSTAAAGSSAIIGAAAGANWTDASRPSFVFFETTASGSTTRTRRWAIGDTGHLLPNTDNTYDLGNGSTRVRQIYSNNATISTSDANLKQDFRPLSEKEIAAGIVLASAIGVFRWKSSVAEKGDEARFHVGVYAQTAVKILEDHGLDPFAYGIICFDEWEASASVIDEHGDVVIPGVDAGSRYGVRYEQLSMFVSAAIASKLASI